MKSRYPLVRMRLRLVGLLATLVLLASACGEEGANLASSTSSPSPTAATTATPEPEQTEAPSPTPEATTTPDSTAAPPVEPKCRNSTDESCGKFSFDPKVTSDAPVEVKATFSPADPEPGEKVTFKLEARDPDSQVVELGTYEFAEGGPGVIVDPFPGECPRAYGKWDPPKKIEGDASKSVTHRYQKSGTYKATFFFFSSSYEGNDHRWPAEPPGDEDGFCMDPLASSGKATVTVKVAPPKTPTPAPSP